MNRKKKGRVKQILMTDHDHVYFCRKTQIQDCLRWAVRELQFVWHLCFYCSAGGHMTGVHNVDPHDLCVWLFRFVCLFVCLSEVSE